MESINGGCLEQGGKFLWGSATSAYQVEGGNQWCDWYKWEKKQGIEPCGQAVRHYQKFKDDFSWARRLGQQAHRLSLEWSRLEREPGIFISSEIKHYHEVMETLKKNNLRIFLTLHHFTLPLWLSRQGGWENPESINYFKRYVNFIVKTFGSKIDFWLTINEPLVLATEGYLFGHWPPQIKSRQRMFSVLKNLALAHKAAYVLIKQQLPGALVGLPHNFLSLEPLRANSYFDKLSVRRADYFWNKLIMELTDSSHDFLAVNYYFHQRVYFSLNPSRNFTGFADPKKLKKEVSALGWEVYPAGLEEILLKMWQDYNLPVYVTENGIALQDQDQQERFILHSTKAVKQARHQGADVRGYFYWSLLDNFEWDKGFGPKFGLLAVDRNDFSRQPRKAALVYADICADKN